jgi:3-hydroxyacyl-CoA dehydrogenase/enoyl-CoA hydratase/3-hydroxybutyryl-CoA epimerase
MVLLMVNEAAACVREQLADSPQAIDLAMILGTGWAPHRGGPLRYADDSGLSRVVATLKELADAQGPRFAPSVELCRRQEAGRAFYERPFGKTGDGSRERG